MQPLLESVAAPDSGKLAEVSLPRIEIKSLYSSLSHAVDQQTGREDFLLMLMQHVAAIGHAEAAVYYVRQENGELSMGPRLFAASMENKLKDFSTEVKSLVIRVSASGTAESATSAVLDGTTCIASPVRTEHGGVEVLLMLVRLGQQSANVYLAFAQLAAGYVNLFDARKIGINAAREARDSACFIESMARSASIANVREARYTMLNDCQRLLGCTHAALVSIDAGGGKHELLGISGLRDFDRRSSLSKSLVQIGGAVADADSAVVWPVAESEDSEYKPAFERLHELASCQFSIAVALQRDDGLVNAALLCWWKDMPADTEYCRQLMDASVIPLGALVEVQSRRGPVGWNRQAAKTEKNSARLRRLLLSLLLLLGIGAMFVPVPYRISASVAIEPTTSRVVSAPFDGILDRVWVKPGQQVNVDMVLATLDGRDLRIQLSDVDAQISTAKKRRDIMRAEGNTHGAQLANLELDRMLIKQQLLQRRLQNLEIKSPVDGIVVSGDVERLERSPVGIGQIMFEVAPLDNMVAEVGVPSEDIGHITNGMPVTMHIDGISEETWQAQLGDLSPRAELRAGENVFISQSRLENTAQLLKPGMQGNAKIHVGKEPLGWVLFHKPWEQFRQWMAMDDLPGN